MQGQGTGASLLEKGGLRVGSETGHHTGHVLKGLPNTGSEAPVPRCQQVGDQQQDQSSDPLR